LVAAPYFSLPGTPRYIGVENKLNYIYRPKGHLSRTEVMGIAALLNSNLFDTYFRTFNGNVNVSATELRAMPLPPLETIKEIGKKLILLGCGCIIMLFSISIDLIPKLFPHSIAFIEAS
jgi:adenine-specific DNA-methyltransferase